MSPELPSADLKKGKFVTNESFFWGPGRIHTNCSDDEQHCAGMHRVTLRSAPQSSPALPPAARTRSFSPDRFLGPRPATAGKMHLREAPVAAMSEDHEPAQSPVQSWGSPMRGRPWSQLQTAAIAGSLTQRPHAVQGALRAPLSARYNRERHQSIADACPIECPIQGHAGQPSDRVHHVSAHLKTLLPAGRIVAGTQYSANKFRVFGANAMVAWTAVQLCDVLSGLESTTLRAAAAWGLGSLVCELPDLQNFIGGSLIAQQIFADAEGAGHKDATLQSCAVFAVACLARFNTNLQLRAASNRALVQKIGAVLQESTSTAVLYANLQAVGNICYNNLRAQQQFALDGVLGTVDALCQARDKRIQRTACSCREAFVLLLSRGPDLRLPVSILPFDRRASESWDVSDAPTIPSPHRRSTSQHEIISHIPARRPTTALGGGRMQGSSPRASRPDSARPLGMTSLPSTEHDTSLERGWVPLKSPATSSSWNAQSTHMRPQGALAQPLQMSQHSSKLKPPSTSSSPIMNVRRIKTGSKVSPTCQHPGAGICVTWSTSPHAQDTPSQTTIRKASFDQAEDALARVSILKISIPDFLGPKADSHSPLIGPRIRRSDCHQ